MNFSQSQIIRKNSHHVDTYLLTKHTEKNELQ